MRDDRNKRYDLEQIILFPISLDDLEHLIRECIQRELEEWKGVRPVEEDRVIDSKELCAECGISLPTLIKYRREGVIPFFRVGNRVRFNRRDVIEALVDFGKLDNKM